MIRRRCGQCLNFVSFHRTVASLKPDSPLRIGEGLGVRSTDNNPTPYSNSSIAQRFCLFRPESAEGAVGAANGSVGPNTIKEECPHHRNDRRTNQSVASCS